MPGSHRFDDFGSATFTRLFTVAIFNCLLLVPAVLAVPSALGASVARRREGRQSQFNNRSEQTASVILVNPAWAGSVLTASNVHSTGYSTTAIGLIHILSDITGEFHLGHWGVHRPHPIGFERVFRRRLGWYRW